MGGMDNDTSIGLAQSIASDRFWRSKEVAQLRKEYLAHPKAQFLYTLKEYENLGKTTKERWHKAFKLNEEKEVPRHIEIYNDREKKNKKNKERRQRKKHTKGAL